MSTTVKVSLSAAQLEEAQHKATILCEEQDLLNSYEMTRIAAEALRDRLFSAKPGWLFLLLDECEALAGELENSAEIHEANVEAGDDEARRGLRSMRDAVRKLRAAIAKAQGEQA
jgi:hypothetical protein